MLESTEIVEENQDEKEDPPTAEEEALCLEICHRERGHCSQWRKQLINGSMIIFLIMLNLFMGSSKSKSLIGCKVCSPLYWSLLGLFVIACIVAVYIGSTMAVNEQKLRKKCNMNYSKSEV
jgi:hypothetical protein